MRVAALLVTILILTPSIAADPPGGIRPVGADGRPLNLDFETGTLKDWTPEGDAFLNQPIRGDTVSTRRGDMASQHQGTFWIGTYERKGDKPQGTLTSVPFRITHPWSTFLIGGGPHESTCVELLLLPKNEVLFRASGRETENMERVAVDLRAYLGKEMAIRLVDRHNGHWGHVNFDDFRFHSDKPSVPARPTVQAPPPPDAYRFAGLPPKKAAEVMTVPEGFSVTLFAGEPDIMQPIAMTLDDRGRVWVAEAYSYPQRRADKDAKDRIVIFEDVDGDGAFDKRTVFMEELNLVSGLEVGFGGVWIGAAPYLMFVPIKAGEDRPAGPAQILLDGWHYEDTHETLNTFQWGPDGWLYGCHGVFTHSRVGKPGTPDKERTPINAGVWRYHPTRHVFEVFAHGTSNPWGLDFDDRGQAFVEACVIPHSFHIIQGGRYLRQAGQHFNPHTYADINTIADHRHYIGATPHGGNERSDGAGGGHAHCGLMIYLGGTWPERYRGQVFMGNIHGRRLNVDVLSSKGSGYVASHGKDFLLANDAWSRFINFRYGPDGNVYVIDWYDKQACHRNEPQIWDRSNGRIYKISYRGAKPEPVGDLARLSDADLIARLSYPNDWHVRHARRILQERYGEGKGAPEARGAVTRSLERLAFGQPDETRKLRGLWALHSVGGTTEATIERGLRDPSPYVRAWTIQLALDKGRTTGNVLEWLVNAAAKDPSPVVRLYLASAAGRIGPGSAKRILEGLLSRSEDATDHNLPLMYWYAAEPLAETHTAEALDLALRSRVPQILPFMVRRLSSSATPAAVASLVDVLARTPDSGPQRLILQGLQAGLKGRRRVEMPASWPGAYAKVKAAGGEGAHLAHLVGTLFGQPEAIAALESTLRSSTTKTEQREEALEALVATGEPRLARVVQSLLSDSGLRASALRALASFDDPQHTPAAILGIYGSLSIPERRDALNTLAARASYGKALLEAVATKKVPATDIPAEVLRQLRNLKDKDLDARLAEVWGVVRTTPADRLKVIAATRKMVTGSTSPPDLALGRALFAKTCQQCHTLFGVGSKVGPDITGSNRADLNYILENILDPSAVIPNEYKATQIELKNGRVITGIVRGETPAALTVLTANETLTIPRGEVESRTPSNTSMMPDDLLKTLNEAEIRALVAYLRSPAQTPLLATGENAKDFFNGRDLAGWEGDPKLWSVENGEIVGRSPGLKENAFLRSHMLAGDFRLTVRVKLTPDAGNSGIQFRSEALPGGDIKGPQADIGAGWWGKLYEEHGRGLIWKTSGEAHVRPGEWNEYRIVAEGSRIRTWINGQLCVDLDDPPGARRGIFALQLHSGGPMEVRFKDLRLDVGAAGPRAEKR